MQDSGTNFLNFIPGNILKSLAVCMAVFLLSGCSEDAQPLTPDLKHLVSNQVESLIQSDFPDLKDITIEYVTVTEDTDTVFFETYVNSTTVLWSPKHRTYQIFANERLSIDRPDDGAIRAILAHELFHIRDYLGKSLLGLLRLKRDYEDDSFRRQYERSTDQRTLELGYGPGLIRYRKWLYRTIGDPEKVKYKRHIYMTPEEIESWLSSHK